MASAFAADKIGGIKYTETVTAEEIMESLKKYAYTFIKIIIVRKSDGEEEAQYIKAYDGNGYIVFITLTDFVKKIAVADYKTLYEEKPATDIPLSVLTDSVISKKGLGTVVALGPSLCITTNLNNGECKQQYLTCIENNIKKDQERYIPIAYAQVGIADIIQDLSGTMNRTKKFYEDQMESIFKLTQDKLDSILKSAEYLNFAIESFVNNRKTAFDGIKNIRSSRNNKFYSTSPDKLKDEDHKKYACDMNMKNETFEQYVVATHRFNKHMEAINPLIAKVVEINNTIVTAYELANAPAKACYPDS